MPLTRQEIIDYASRYVLPADISDFPFDGDLFCLLGRELPEGKVLAEEEGWGFQGYGICAGYTVDDESKPAGKWLRMHFASLATFPPSAQTIKLQPPHVVKGRFQEPGRSREFRMIKVGISPDKRTGTMGTVPDKFTEKSAGTTVPAETQAVKDNIVPFRKKKT
jgi:hypothetical protein